VLNKSSKLPFHGPRRSIKSYSTYRAVSLPCHAVPLRVWIVSFPFDLHSAAVFDSYMPCRNRAIPRPCRSESDFSRPRHRAAWTRHERDIARVNYHCPSRYGMWATSPRSASSGHHAEFHEGCYQKHTNPLNRRTSSSDISGYHTDLHEGNCTVGEWQGRAASIF
jgi:hypothetical protein